MSACECDAFERADFACCGEVWEDIVLRSLPFWFFLRAVADARVLRPLAQSYVYLTDSLAIGQSIMRRLGLVTASRDGEKNSRRFISFASLVLRPVAHRYPRLGVGPL